MAARPQKRRRQNPKSWRQDPKPCVEFCLEDVAPKGGAAPTVTEKLHNATTMEIHNDEKSYFCSCIISHVDVVHASSVMWMLDSVIDGHKIKRKGFSEREVTNDYIKNNEKTFWPKMKGHPQGQPRRTQPGYFASPSNVACAFQERNHRR